MAPIAQTNIQLYEQLRRAGYGDEAVTAAARAYAFAQPLFSARFRGSGRPFLCHLVGTASILARDGARIEEVTAGLLHAAYEAGLFAYEMHRTVAPRKRAAVREAVGEASEALIAAYTALPWTGSTLERLVASGVRSPEEESVLRLRLANELDDLADGGLRYTGLILVEPWLDDLWLGYALLLVTAYFSAEEPADPPREATAEESQAVGQP
jgi:hypothetical protein